MKSQYLPVLAASLAFAFSACEQKPAAAPETNKDAAEKVEEKVEKAADAVKEAAEDGKAKVENAVEAVKADAEKKEESTTEEVINAPAN